MICVSVLLQPKICKIHCYVSSLVDVEKKEKRMDVKTIKLSAGHIKSHTPPFPSGPGPGSKLSVMSQVMASGLAFL